MRSVSVTARIGAPRERIYPLIADMAARPAFTDHFMHELRLQRIDSTGVGASARLRLVAPRAAIWMETVIAETDPPFRVVERGKGGRSDRVRIDTVWELTAGPGDSTDVSLTFAIDPVAAADRIRYALVGTSWYRRQFKRALTRLRDLAETGSVPELVGVGGGSRLGQIQSQIQI